MKKLLLAIFAIALFKIADAQFIKRMADRAKNKMEQKAGQKMDKGIDDVVDGKKKDKTKKADDADESDKTESDDNTSDESGGTDAASTSSSSKSKQGETSEEPTLQTYSKYDFIPGDKVIAFEDFSTADIGDFPVRWNTNATAEVVTVNGKEGKWLKLEKQGAFHPEFITDLPENFTLEFDVLVNDGWNSYPIALNITKLEKPEEFRHYGYSSGGSQPHNLHVNFKPSVKSSTAPGNSALHANASDIYNNVDFKNWQNTGSKLAHISVWRQKQRLRVYLNGQKIWDLPKAFDAALPYNAITFGVHDAYKDGDFFLLSNIRLAIGSPDTRNKLITEGKFVTRGILFDVNSDVVKAESYGTIKDIANVLKENANVRVKVIGHTDSDGDDKANLDLSKRRASSVKDALVSEFGIDASRIETDGKGESAPVDKAETALGKANNRRVEFIKL